MADHGGLEYATAEGNDHPAHHGCRDALHHLGGRIEAAVHQQRIGPHVADAAVRQQLLDAALRLGAAARYRNLGTIEFLVDER